MGTHPKLVRDGIPDLIRSHGGQPKTRRLSDEEFVDALARKLVEEAEEVAATPTVEELADVLEVVRALARELGHSIGDVERMRQSKAHERGGFERRLLLESGSRRETAPPAGPKTEPGRDASSSR